MIALPHTYQGYLSQQHRSLPLRATCASHPGGASDEHRDGAVDTGTVEAVNAASRGRSRSTVTRSGRRSGRARSTAGGPARREPRRRRPGRPHACTAARTRRSTPTRAEDTRVVGGRARSARSARARSARTSRSAASTVSQARHRRALGASAAAARGRAAAPALLQARPSDGRCPLPEALRRGRPTGRLPARRRRGRHRCRRSDRGRQPAGARGHERARLARDAARARCWPRRSRRPSCPPGYGRGCRSAPPPTTMHERHDVSPARRARPRRARARTAPPSPPARARSAGPSGRGR